MSGCCLVLYCFFFFNDTATTEIYTLSLHDALPISLFAPGGVGVRELVLVGLLAPFLGSGGAVAVSVASRVRSEEHTSELQSRLHLVCRLLLEKKNMRKDCRALLRHGGVGTRFS